MSAELVIMTAHSAVVRVEDPTMPAYDTRDLKLHKARRRWWRSSST